MTVTNTSKNRIIVASADSFQVTTTSATDVLTYTVERDANYSVSPYVVVQSATTSITLALAWTDPIAGAVTYSWYTTASKVVGVYTLPPQHITALMGTAITLTATAGTANNIYISADIETGEW